MTARPAHPSGAPQRRSLSLVPQADGGKSDWRAETLLRQWNPEDQLIGALLHMSAAQAAPILELVPDTAIWRSDNRWAIEIIRHLVADGCDPDPVLVLGTARHRPPADALHPDQPVRPRLHHRFAVHLANIYTHAVTPAAAPHYAAELLDEAYRRAVGSHGVGMAALAERNATREELTHYVTTMRAELADLWRRAEAARH